MPLSISRLDRSQHDRKAFDCGIPELNRYLAERASKHQKQGVVRVYVLTDDGQPDRILGYYALANSHIARDDLQTSAARRLPRHPVPTITLGRLAVDHSAQGKGYGVLLLADAVKRCALVSHQVGVYGLVVDAKDDAAKAFYERFGFTEIASQPLRLFLPMATALDAFL